MRAFLITALLLLAHSLPAAEAGDGVVRVWPEYKTSESFERIGEFFGGQERHPGRTIQRSQPAVRAGYYFLIRLKSAQSFRSGRTWLLEVIYPGSDKAKGFRFPFDPETAENVTELGLTGSDWENPSAQPNAWRLRLLDAEGRELLSRQSFLWR